MIIRDNLRLPKNVLLVIATLGWAIVLYLAWEILVDSWQRSYFSIGALMGQIPELDPFNNRYRAHPIQTLFHTVSGVVFAVLGPMQFMSPIRERFRVIHRVTGRIFLPFGIMAGVAALVMGISFPVWGKGWNQVITTLWALFMIYAFVKAFLHIRKREIKVHREWMIRGFAAGFGVSLFRVVLNDVLPRMGYDFTESWNIVMVISAPIILLVAEFWIRVTRPKKQTRSA